MENAKKRMNHAEELFKTVRTDNEKLEEILRFLQEADKRSAPLAAYYFDEWLEDYTDLAESDFRNEVMNEDSIFEEITAQYESMKKILLVCAEYINRNA